MNALRLRTAMAILEIRTESIRRAGHPAAMDPQRQGHRRHRVFDFEPHLVHRLGRRPQRNLFPDHRSAAGSRPAVPGQRRRKFFPRRAPRHGQRDRVPRRARPRRAHHLARSRRPLPAHQGNHRRPASALPADRHAARRRRSRLSSRSFICMCCSRRIWASADGATMATWR